MYVLVAPDTLNIGEQKKVKLKKISSLYECFIFLC